MNENQVTKLKILFDITERIPIDGYFWTYLSLLILMRVIRLHLVKQRAFGLEHHIKLLKAFKEYEVTNKAIEAFCIKYHIPSKVRRNFYA